MQQFQVRTDLALEATESVRKSEAGNLRGIAIEEYDAMEDVHISKVVILSKNAAKSMGKPMGTYITLEAADLQESDEDYHREISKELAKQLRGVLPDIHEEKSILVVGLGNRDVTADSLGPCTVDNLFITRHIIKEYGKQAYRVPKIHQISALVPGVMAKTGMETAEIIKGVIKETKPDIVIVIDALAARSTKRLNRTVQITDTGIHPGSGVGNHRNKLNQESLGVPVIAVGVPTVVSAAAIVYDTLDALTTVLEQSEVTSSLSGTIKSMDMDDQYRLIQELLHPRLGPMFVTPKDIDAVVKRLSFTISEGMNMAFHA